MKPTQALIACSLLGSVWLASCSGDNKKAALTPEGDAGEAGSSAGAPAGGSAHGGASGLAGSTVTAGEAGAAGAAGSAGEAALGGQGGEGGSPPACFNDLNELFAGAPGFDTPPAAAGAGSVAPGAYSCDQVRTALAPTYDQDTHQITLDVSQLGPVAGGDFTFYYFNGDLNTTACGDAAVQVADGKLTLSIATLGAPTQFQLTALKLHDQCGNEAALSTANQNGNCFDLTFHSNVDATPASWQVDCYEGIGCRPSCADFNKSL